MRALAFALLFLAFAHVAGADEAVSPQGRSLAAKLDAMGVESKWIAGAHVDWRTGLPDDVSETLPGRHTHCSAFVAAAAADLGVYILRPPQHGQVLLANAQAEWLPDEGAAQGWRELPDPVAAQAAANQGQLVVVAYESHKSNKPGHIAIVKPAPRTAAQLADEGPVVIQAGTVNSAAVSLRDGFAGHPAAWRDHEARFYAHALKSE